ncbi:MAG TPA: VWA domain-containing protein [Rhodocyclaceae bacterium]
MVTLDDLLPLLSGPDREARLRGALGEATRALSASGLEAWARGAAALRDLGRGEEPVANFLDHGPAIARELGEEVLGDLIRAALAMASKTSGTVIALTIASAPTAARRLGDAELFRAYLEFLSRLLALAPRGLRPMLEQLDPLLAQLTLGGLRRWAMWGGQSHRTDYPAQEAYFALKSADSLAMLQQERKGVLFVDVQRRLGMYLRALWGRDFYLRPTAGDWESRDGLKPYIDNHVLHLADAYDALETPAGAIEGGDLYRAAACHGAAHLIHTRAPISAEALTPLQLACIGLIEDARVEALAAQRFPGLAALWRRFHVATPDGDARIGRLLERVARALADADYEDAHPAVQRARLMFAAGRERLESNHLSWDCGVALAHDLLRAGLDAYHPRLDQPQIAYRDDNRYVWEFAEAHDFASAAPWLSGQVRKQVGLMEFINEVDVETAGSDAQEIWVLGSELLDDDGSSWNQREGKPPAPEPFHYNEWDYQIQIERPSWVTLLERDAEAGDASRIGAMLEAHRPVAGRLRRVIEMLQPQGVQRLRKLEHGDEIDLNAAVEAAVDIRCGRQPDPRIQIRHQRKVRDISILLLLDLSESTKDVLPGSDRPVLELACEASALLADALAQIGDRFAIHGFSSNGRHDVDYRCFKGFDEPYGERAKARLAGMAGGGSTRIGAAIRHAGRHLARQPSQKKLLLVLTDGEPADVDVRDPQYLRADSKKAVEAIGRQGVSSFCLSLDPRASQYVARIFGGNRFFVLDHVQRLPEKLPALFLGLTR